jgi:hypothetical protein
MRTSTSSSRKDKDLATIPSRKVALALGAALTIGLTAPAFATAAPSTRLVSCGDETCLLVSGHRDSARDEVRINGHHVDVQGKRGWRVNLPVATVRDWSAPFARRIEVSMHNPMLARAATHQAVLPIGLLGHVPDLATLVITLH